MYGFGNWKDVSVHVGKPDIECRAHYEDVYLVSADAPLPPKSLVMASSTASAPMVAGNASVARETTGTPPPQAVACAGVVPGPKHGPDDNQLAISSHTIRAHKQAVAAGGDGDGPSLPQVVDPDVAGFMPLRGDFDVEWDNDAELLLADMEFREGEHATETELKLKVIEIYNAKLDERERRKRFVLERGLLDFKARLAEERKRPREEREIRNMLRPFARFHTHADHERLVDSLLEEHRLRRRIAQLQHWRRQGVRTLAEAQEFEKAKQYRLHELKLRRHRDASVLPAASDAVPAGVSASSSASSSSVKRRRERAIAAAEAAAEAQWEQTARQAEPGVADDDLSAGSSATSVLRPPASQDAASTAAAAAAEPVDVKPDLGPAPAQPAQASSASSSSSSSSFSSSSLAAARGPLVPGELMAPADPRRPPAARSGSPDSRRIEDEFSVAGAPGVDALTPVELQVCSHMRLLPTQFAAIKQAILKAAGTPDTRLAASAGRAAGASEAQAAAVFDLCVSCGWVRAEPGGRPLRADP